MQRIGLIANPEKNASRSIVQEAVHLIQDQGGEVLLEPKTAALVDTSATHQDITSLAKDVEMLIVFGGDGTMLGVARQMEGASTPILGVNVGGLGFLTAIQRHQLEDALAAIQDRVFSLESRSLIEASGNAAGAQIYQTALNDFVFSRGVASRLIELEVLVDQEVLTRYRCDGLIVSSPTGSTAYSLAAGGAVVSPTTPVFTITPVCPHTLSARSVIVSLDSIVQVKVLSEKLEVFLTADGQVQVPLQRDDLITLRQSRQSIRLVRLPGSSFFNTLRQKLNWSGSNL
ncbi:MAG: NAD(+)/NADH kinase [Verrucomicrobiota bacterium]|nr:NAD(+)/NADH kinase [Verrucomicrobiota bacterium]